jgi:Leucine-rich repeat (LRR) protein
MIEKILFNALPLIIVSFALFSCRHTTRASYSLAEALDYPNHATNVVIEEDGDIEFLPRLAELRKLNTLEIRNRKIKMLPPEARFHDGIVFLTIKADSLEFPKQVGEIDSLFELTVTCKVSDIPDEVVNLKKLETVRLINCNLKTFPTALLKIPNISTLDLSRNQITELPPDIVFPGSLTELRLNANPIHYLPVGVFNGGILWLRFSGMGLKSLPEGIRFKGTSIDLSGNQLTELPDDMEANNLFEIFLGDNKFSEFPKALTKFTALKRVLSIGSNAIKSVPKEIGNLRALQYLSLDNNQLNTLPPEIGNLTELEELHLENNSLRTLPDEISQLKKLRLLTLMGNTLTDEEITKLNKIQYLEGKIKLWD